MRLKWLVLCPVHACADAAKGLQGLSYAQNRSRFGKLITAAGFINDRIEETGRKPWGTHSIRIGGDRSASHSLPVETRKKIGDWKSDGVEAHYQGDAIISNREKSFIQWPLVSANALKTQ